MPQTLGRYTIEDQLGEGSFAWVYRATDAKLKRTIALKVLKPMWMSDPSAIRRFEQEATTMANLHHPHIAEIYDVDKAEGQVYLAQFLVEGETLGERLKRGPLSWAKTLTILQGVADALDYAHGQGIIHRDLKPANILLDQNDKPYLSDFGLILAAEGSVSISSSSGGMVGTPYYMAPEQWRGETATSATDVYALSCAVVEMLTGKYLFDGSSSPAIMTKHVMDPPEFPDPWPSDVPDGVEAVLERGLAKDPAERIQSAGDLAAQLAALSDGTKPVAAAAPGKISPAQPAPQAAAAGKGMNKGLLFGGGAVVLVLIVCGILFFAFGGSAGNKPTPVPTEVPVIVKNTSTPIEEVEPTVDTEATIAAAVEATRQAEPTNTPTETSVADEVITAIPGEALDMVLLPKFLGIYVFDQVYNGAQEAAAELQADGNLEYIGPSPENSVAGQIEMVTTAATQGVDAIMINNNAGDQIAPAVQAARDAGMTVVTWDTPIPSAEGEDVFIHQVDFDETGTVMADMALSIMGDEGGQFAVLSASSDASNQNSWIAAMEKVLKDSKYANLELVDIVYGNDRSEDSYNQALALVDKYPDLKLIMAPTTVGIGSAAQAMQDEGLCDQVKVSGLGLPAEMVSYTLNGCAPEFALWSFVDMGYLTYYTTYLIASGQMQPAEGITFEVGRMGTYTIEKDPTRDEGLRVLMGPWTIYDKNNVEAAAK